MEKELITYTTAIPRKYLEGKSFKHIVLRTPLNALEHICNMTQGLNPECIFIHISNKCYMYIYLTLNSHNFY